MVDDTNLKHPRTIIDGRDEKRMLLALFKRIIVKEKNCIMMLGILYSYIRETGNIDKAKFKEACEYVLGKNL